MGFEKLTADLAGMPVATHSLLAFEQCLSVDRIIVVTRQERVAEFESMGKTYQIGKLTRVVAGGEQRHLSVWNGVQAGNPNPGDYIAVHDAARPLITPTAIEGCLAMARQHGASVCAAPVPDTLKRVSADGFVSASVERDNIWAMQTPQIFLASILAHAYKLVLQTGEAVTDEVSAVQKLGISVALFKNEELNFKITVPRDLDLARLVLGDRKSLTADERR